ncbi:aminotransferase class I/II-fold pyridoxal phosphate-dependent enzyme [Marinicella gelatinilytica]|uniref:aminotransferase class I/II-fold pyridoxal phosphate-dependent enzyme n=1 Tax=Marinicella gelatinilytica TaxID=2996017 RepID=UPI002260BD80|nr:aminotransferase class I/II-fold pyridoxal phosphate-dependent enzyme [Marinicella gelatinilytica]MCX7544228.1 aminotransferase class I/II-fold pyridoxal phosphate-dependent enzyme [Marinicella gelatinilytica]
MQELPQQPRYKLDFNERSDHQPDWIAQAKVNTDNLWQYPNRQRLEQQLAQDLTLPNDAVLLTNGGDEGIDLLFKYSTINNKQLLIPEPCFSQYSHNAEIWQNDCRFISVDASKPLAINQGLLIQNIQANQWLVITRPNNPTGEIIYKSDLMTLIKAAEKTHAKVFIDEAYIEFSEPEKSQELISAEDYIAMNNVVVLRTFSKAFGLAGVRVGYLLGNPELINQFRRLAPPFNVSSVGLQLATQAWQNRDQVLPYTRQIASNRQRLTQQLNDYGVEVFPSQGNFVLFNASDAMKTLLFNVLQRHGILIKTALNGLPSAVRITVPFNLDTLSKVLDKVFSPKLIAFDMDGVLIDTGDSYDQCIINTVRDLSGATVNKQDIQNLRDAGGYNNDWDLSLALLKNRGYSGELDRVITVFQNHYLGQENQVGLIEQERTLISMGLLQQLKQDNGLNTAVVTGRPRAEAQLGLAKINWQPHEVINADDVSRQKPDPEGLLQIKNTRLVDDNAGCWFIGDTVDDMQAGRAAGFICIGIGPDESLLTQAGADLVLNNVNQMESLL